MSFWLVTCVPYQMMFLWKPSLLLMLKTFICICSICLFKQPLYFQYIWNNYPWGGHAWRRGPFVKICWKSYSKTYLEESHVAKTSTHPAFQRTILNKGRKLLTLYTSDLQDHVSVIQDPASYAVSRILGHVSRIQNPIQGSWDVFFHGNLSGLTVCVK